MAKNTKEQTKITVSSGNVFADMGFDTAEAQLLAMRARLMVELERQIKAQGMTQTVAATVLGVTQARVSDLTRGKTDKFSLDTLVTFAAKLGKPVRMEMPA